MRNLVWTAMIATLGCGEELARHGQYCDDDIECESAVCRPANAAATSPLDLLCTSECASDNPCPEDTRATVCGASGYCVVPCVDGQVRDFEPEPIVCLNGIYVPCSSLDPVQYCGSCGCEPFGGGVCVEGTGCQPLRADGEPCAASVECASGVCFMETGTCAAPAAMGSRCRVDAECETRNCSTDGDETLAGVCYQALGSSCESGDTTCNRCIGDDALSSGICSRDFCDPINARNCPTVGERRWSCEESVDGRYRCYEVCTPEAGYNCLEDLLICHENGFCS